MIKSRVEIKHFSIVGLMSPCWVRTQVRTHSDFCWTRGLGLGLGPTGLRLGLGLWSSGLGLGLGLWSNGLGLTPDELGLWSYGLGLRLWPCGLRLTAGLTSPDSLQHWKWQTSDSKTCNNILCIVETYPDNHSLFHTCISKLQSC